MKYNSKNPKLIIIATAVFASLILVFALISYLITNRKPDDMILLEVSEIAEPTPIPKPTPLPKPTPTPLSKIESDSMLGAYSEVEIEVSVPADMNIVDENEELYREVLDLYYATLANYLEWHQEAKTWDRGFMSHFNYHGFNYLEIIGYTFVDLDHNGIPELLIGFYDPRFYVNESVYDIWTKLDDNFSFLLSASSFQHHGTLYSNLHIGNWFTSGGGAGVKSFYVLESGKDSLTHVETMTWTAGWLVGYDDIDTLYYHTFDEDDLYNCPINYLSDEEYQKISKRLAEKYQPMAIVYKPFSEYIPSDLNPNPNNILSMQKLH